MKSTITHPDSMLAKVFEAEGQRLLNDRASYVVKTTGNGTIISVTAKDATSLRAVLNSICKLIIIYEKSKEVINDES